MNANVIDTTEGRRRTAAFATSSIRTCSIAVHLATEAALCCPPPMLPK
jgi:hypothetical protein